MDRFFQSDGFYAVCYALIVVAVVILWASS